jgi:hypothetical protein
VKAILRQLALQVGGVHVIQIGSTSPRREAMINPTQVPPLDNVHQPQTGNLTWSLGAPRGSQVAATTTGGFTGVPSPWISLNAPARPNLPPATIPYPEGIELHDSPSRRPSGVCRPRIKPCGCMVFDPPEYPPSQARPSAQPISCG